MHSPNYLSHLVMVVKGSRLQKSEKERTLIPILSQSLLLMPIADISHCCMAGQSIFITYSLNEGPLLQDS
ncbi:hypothetical protein VitviT2T_006064 [Vitis vinifera]|uniref:Uncharacterized protein n=1 Tax=Vitis vinifera TaxID=29760 RepID=A0ABY9BUU3_VITVI|nr:hypothetical protein VitviT2T_006064 [Vitis vinifera]